MNGCPSEFALDDRQIHGRAAPGDEAHLQACASCRARIGQRVALMDEFEAVAAPTWTRILAEAGARRRRWRRALPLGLVGIAAAAAGLVVFARPAVDALPTPKGSALAEIICRRGAETFPVGPGDEVAPGDALRFRPLPVWPPARYIQIGSVDGTGGYAPFYPASDDAVSVALPPAGAALAGSIRLDDAPGPERLFVVLSVAPLATRDVARAALAHGVAGDPIDRIGGDAVVTSWIVLPKRGRVPAAP